MRKLILSAVSVLLCIMLIAGCTDNPAPSGNESSPKDTSSELVSSEDNVSSEDTSSDITSSDEDIIGMAPADQMRLNMHGDLLELFFHPENAMHFWEFHAAPNSRSAAFYFLTGDMLSLTELTGQTKLPDGLKCAATVDGKINDQKTEDKAWMVEMQIPRRIFAAEGTPFEPNQKWRIRLGRWNTSHNLYAVQKSYFPEQPYNRALQRQYFAPAVFK